MSYIETSAKEKERPSGLNDLFKLAELRKYFQPKTERGRELSSFKSEFWREPAYPHKQLMVSVWIYLVEKKLANQLSSDDIANLAHFLDWICSLEEDLTKAEKPERRKRQPVFLMDQTKKLMQEQIVRLKDRKEFMKIEGWRNFLVSIARGYVLLLNKNNIFGVSPLEAEKWIANNLSRMKNSQ